MAVDVEQLKDSLNSVPPTLFAPLVALIFFGLVGLSRLFTRKSQLPLPPGPRRLPLIGNFFDLRGNSFSWLRYIDWQQLYGDVIYVDLFGRGMVIVNSAKAANELFEKRSSNYSDRPDMNMVNGLMKWDWVLAHMRYSDDWRAHRKMFHQFFQQGAIPNYQPVQRRATNKLLQNLLEKPEGYSDYIKNHAGSVILWITYGYEIQPTNDYYVELSAEAIRHLGKANNSGTYLVDYLPILKKIPSWFPGAAFKRNAQKWAISALDLRDRPYELLKQSIAEGTATNNFVTNNLAKAPNSEAERKAMEIIIRACAGNAYLAGMDTTWSTAYTFILAMVINPEAQTRAQAELDAVVGRGRLPDFPDRSQLPFVDAILWETLRWIPVGPTALPHRVINEDVYEGYRIPAGVTVVGNSWAILHDPEVYTDPNSFKPERFIQTPTHEPAPDPVNAFGFGRRVCPGRHLARDSVWIMIATILHCFNIQRAKDADGKEIIPAVGCTGGAASHPLPFECVIVPRADAIPLIKHGYENVH